MVNKWNCIVLCELIEKNVIIRIFWCDIFIIKLQDENSKIVLTNRQGSGIINSIQKIIKGRRLNPLDNVKNSTTQYVSGMADISSRRLSLNHREISR